MTNERNKAEGAFPEIDDPALRNALTDFKASVHTWSDAAYASACADVRPMASPAATPAAARLSLRSSLVWALSLILSAGAVSGAVYERHHQQVLAREQLQREQQLEQQKQLAAEQHARDTEDLLAKIDSDISREVPAAMEPLAHMMVDDGGIQ